MLVDDVLMLVLTVNGQSVGAPLFYFALKYILMCHGGVTYSIGAVKCWHSGGDGFGFRALLGVVTVAMSRLGRPRHVCLPGFDRLFTRLDVDAPGSRRSLPTVAPSIGGARGYSLPRSPLSCFWRS